MTLDISNFSRQVIDPSQVSGAVTASVLKGRRRDWVGDFYAVAMAAPPSTVLGAVNGATSIASGADHNTASGSALNTTDFTFYGRHYLFGGQDATACVIGPGTSSGFSAPNVLQSAFPAYSGNAGLTRIEFLTDASQLEVVFRASGASVRVRVNGQSIGVFDIPGAAGAYRLYIGGTTPLPSGLNRITVEGSSQPVRAVRVPITFGIWPSPLSGPKMCVVGDSFMVATVLVDSDGAAPGGLSQNIGYKLGIPNTISQGISSTGVVATAGSRPNYGQRIGDLTAESPDVVWVWGSINDFAQSAIQATTLSYLQAVKAALPNALVFMTSPPDMVGSGGNLTNLQSIEAPYAAACADLTVNVPFINLRTAAPMTGTGRVGTPVGDGNRDRYTNTDGIHPAGAGMAFIASQAAAQIETVLQSTVRAV